MGSCGGGSEWSVVSIVVRIMGCRKFERDYELCKMMVVTM